MLGTSRVIATVLASVLLTSPVLAQPNKTPPTDGDKAKAGEMVKQAIAKSQAGDHSGAVELYLKAYSLVPLAVLLSNVGTEYQQAAKLVEALRYFCLYLHEEPTGTNAAYATSQAKVLQIQLGNPVPDDKKVCDKPEPAGPTGPTGPTTGGTGPGVGDPMGPTGGPGSLGSTEPSDPGKGLKLGGMVAGGLGVVGLVVGFYFGSKAKTISDDISNHTDPNIKWRDDIKAYEQEGQHDENLQITFLVAGGVLVAGGAIMYMLGRSKTSSKTETSVSIGPMPLRAGGGFAVSGGF